MELVNTDLGRGVGGGMAVFSDSYFHFLSESNTKFVCAKCCITVSCNSY